MSIIKKFVFQFLSDSSQAKKGFDETESATRRLTTAFKSADQVVNTLTGSFKSAAIQVGGFLGAFLGARALLSGLSNTIRINDKLDELSGALGANVSDLNAWSAAAELSGGTAESFYETAKTLTASLAEFATKGKSRSAIFFQELGVEMTDASGKARGFAEVLPELADAFSKLGKEESFGIGRKLGFDEGTIILLQQGRREIDDIIRKQKELNDVTAEDAATAAKFHDQLTNLEKVFRSIFTIISSSVLPVFTTLLNWFERVGVFAKKNGTLIKGVFIALGTAITVYLLPPLIRAAAAAFVLYAPFLAIGAVIATLIGLFALLYEDINYFLAGHKSITGDILAKYPKLIPILKEIGRVAKNVWESLIFIEQVLQKFFARLYDSAIIVGEGITVVISRITEGFLAAVDLIRAAWESLKESIAKVGEFMSNVGDKIKSSFQGIKNSLGFGDAEVTADVTKTINAVTSNPVATQSSGTILNSKTASKTTSVSIQDVNISTQATDAEGIAQGISKALSAQMSQAINTVDDGVFA